jgi:hypothetical protein
MDGRLPLEQLASRLHRRPFAVDAVLAGLIWFVAVLLPAGSYTAGAPRRRHSSSGRS